MTLLLLEALAVLVLVVLMVWWTMFSGRDKGELRADEPPREPETAQPPADEQP